jgi:exopolysaccharide biosynthesis polyprenyl glycosylphosphotransferase
MLKQQARLFTKLSVLMDAGTLIAAFVLTYALIQHIDHRLESFDHYAWAMAIIIPVWLLVLSYSGIYESMRIRKISEIAGQLVKVHLMGSTVIITIIYFVDPRGFSRVLAGGFVLMSLMLMISVKGIVKLTLHHYRRKGYNVRNILIVGSGEQAQHFVQLIQDHADWGLVIAGYLPLCTEPETRLESNGIMIGDIQQLNDICKNASIDEVVFSVGTDQLSEIDDHVTALQEMGITVRMVLDLFDIPTARKEITLFHGEIPILTFYGKAFNAEQLFFKRCLDVVGSLIGLCITTLLLPFIATAIRMESSGPLFFGQERVGENGRTFTCWKFRSMFIDAEDRKKDLLMCNEMQGAMFKMKEDPRVTKVGKFIRKASLDELPQFWNVLIGDMSLVGTRPPTPEEVATYENWHRKRICIKPGITGLWQVSGRNQIQNFDDVVRLDIRYIEEWSLWLDIKLLFKTIWVVISSKGAR